MNISSMTDKELNEAIAKAKGWTRFNPATEFCMEYALPKYVTDGNLTVKLLEEMPLGTIIQKTPKDWLVTNFADEDDVDVRNDRLGRAVAEAWLSVFGGEG